ncbi:MAG: aminopeptidase P family protein [Dysgonamonadaceae bacterium]|jgi:Xaa-Pro aminopeptidase|nr:aminopeptidase P family protein [Dysgonamonadaceae bacterium]
MTVKEKIQLLREAMKAGNIQACIIPSTDPHISEYTPEHWKTRKWISGFTGSAGTVVVTATQAGLWTDSRYFLQAADQLQGTGIELFKIGLPDTPSFADWLAGELSEGDTIGMEGAVFAASEAKSLIQFFSGKNIQVNCTFAPYNAIWNDRPAIPTNPVFILPEQFAGISAREKIKQTRQAIQKEGAGQTILAALDTIAWLFNLRGNDVEYNPVAVAYAVVSEKETVLFIHPEKLTQEVTDYLKGEGIVLAAYEKITDYVKQMAADTKLLVTPAKINYQLYTAIPKNVSIIETTVHPSDQLKSIKNEKEISGIRNAMQRDGAALVKFLIDLEKNLNEGNVITELDISRKLRQYRSEQAYYVGESFGTIAGYGPHGAIVHYGATEDTNAEIFPEGILLVDSGAQYLDGTTDITRTLAVGEVSSEMKKDYTNVLKGHIALATARFPKGTIGMQLDAFARQFLWQNASNYMHGTGHGVGFFLNVHEGPQNIRMEYNPAPLQPGMLTSNEPGLYRANAYGIRIENLILTVHSQTTEFGDFYAFETLTLCPIDKKLIDRSLLNEAEINWLNTYHQKVYESLSPLLSNEEKTWLKQQTNEI